MIIDPSATYIITLNMPEEKLFICGVASGERIHRVRNQHQDEDIYQVYFDIIYILFCEKTSKSSVSRINRNQTKEYKYKVNLL
jgi:hypothetical protein